MANKIIYFGPFNNDQKTKLFNMALDYLKKGLGNKFYYVLSHGGLLKDYRKKFINKTEKVFEVNLFTFDDIVNNILKDEIYFVINDAMKDLVIKKSISKLNEEGKLSYYKNIISTEGFLEGLSYIIGEIKRSLIYPADSLYSCPKIPYFEEIGLIYSEYERNLTSLGLIDREGAYFKAIDHLKNNLHIFDDLDFIIIDEFYDFRPVEMEIIKELAKTNIDIYINIPFEMKSKIPNIDETLYRLKELGFQLEYVEGKEKNVFETIGYNFFHEEVEKLNYTDNIRLIKSPSIYLELKKIFEEIKRHYKNGYKLENMAIVLLNEEYKENLFKVASEEQVPINARREIPLIQVPLVKEFLNLIETRINGGDKQAVISRLKAYYFNIVDYEYMDILEYILRKLNFTNIDELYKIFSEKTSLNISMDYIEYIIGLVERLKAELGLISERDTVENYGKIFTKMIKDYNLKSLIYKRYTKDNNYQLLHRDLQALDKLLKITEDLNGLALIEEKVGIVDYFDAILKTIRNETLLEEDGNIRGVKVLNPISSRGFTHEILFIAGLSSNYYPILKENNFFINDMNHRYLKEIGLDYKSYHNRLNNEVIKFASLVGSCEDILYLSLSEGKEEDSIFSFFLDELLNMFNGERLEEKILTINLDFDYQIKNSIENITTVDELSNFLILNLSNLSEDLKPYYIFHNAKLKDKLRKINEKNYCEYRRLSPDYSEYNGLISDDNIKRDLEEIHLNKVYSNTYLEAYSKCPYYFLLSRILNVDEMERYFQEYKPVDLGNIYHEVLKEYYINYQKYLEDHILDNKVFKVEETSAYLRDLINKYAIQIGFDLHNKLNQLIMDNIHNRLVKFIEKDIERISNPKEKLVPYAFEVEFGKYKDFSIEIDGLDVKFRGKIDRIDKIAGEDKYIIMDYKSSSYGVYDIDKILQGLSLQLPIYALSQVDKNIVAGVYGVISQNKFDVILGIKGETNQVTNRHKGALIKEEWDRLMEETKANIRGIIEKILSGDFSVNPLECSPYCIYKDICRYERVLEVM